ncbi:uncharacterized protein LOC119227877 [Pungitius pungitius]|uniref:uncharacterized protein LOC119227877 n=1 Tax=Pungitius pungitius TaxID=134920 RepID=UPI002E130945
MRQMMVVMSTVELWSSLKALQRGSSEDKQVSLTFSSLGPNQVCDVALDGRTATLLFEDLKQDTAEDGLRWAIDASFKSCTDGVTTFLLLIQGAHYTARERRMVETLQAHFGAEALRYLIVISLEDAKVADTLDDALLELLNVCDGRYCRITSSAAQNGLGALLKMQDRVLGENGVAGYTEAMLTEARRRSTEDSAMQILRRKAHEAGEQERAFKQRVQQQEARRAKEMEELKARQAEERKRESAGKRQHETKRESLEEAVMSHGAMLQIHTTATDDNDTRKMSAILLGLSGSGKSSALNLILKRAGNQYSTDESAPEPPQRLILVDTPELWDEDGVEHLELVKDCLALSLPGPHVFLLVLQVERFTQGECQMLGHLQRIFGRDLAEHAVVLLVRLDGDRRRPQAINDHVAGAHAALRDLIRKCGSRFYELNLSQSQNAVSYPQVRDLLSGMDKLVASHGGRSYTSRRCTTHGLNCMKTRLFV